MNRKNMARNALFTSIISLLLCVSMLVGTTFAWFSDSVESGLNQITAGNLDIELLYHNGSTWTRVNGATNLFSTNLWEPGHAEVVYLKMSNEGTMAFDYNFAINVAEGEVPGTNVDGDEFKLSDYIYFGVTEVDNVGEFDNRDAAIAAISGGVQIKSGYTMNGSMLETTPDKILALVVYMPTTVGNEANYRGESVPQVNLGIKLVASQKQHENDGFDNSYDEEANAGPVVPAAGTETNATNLDESNVANGELIAPVSLKSNDGDVSTEVPAGTKLKEDAEDLKVIVTPKSTVTSGVSVAADEGAVSFDIAIPALSDDNTTIVPVSVKIGKGLTGVKLYHNGVEMTAATTGADGTFTYDAATGVLTVYSSGYSPFDLVYDKAPNVTTAEELIAALKSGADKIVLGADITVNSDWDNRNTGAKTTKPITIDGQGYTLKITGTVSDGGNYHSVFRFEDKAVVKNLTVDLSEAEGYNNRHRVISAKADLTVNNCTFIGNSELNNTRGISYGEGAGAAISEQDVVISNCSFVNWKRGVVDNENAQDAKTVAIKNCTFTNADAYVSAFEKVTFSGNTMKNGAVNIKSYTAPENLEVEAENNKLDNTKNNVLGDVAYVCDADALVEALEKGMDVHLNNDIKIEPAKMSNAYGKTGINVKYGQTIDGHGHTLNIQGAGGTWDSGINTTGGLIKDITVTGSFRGIFINHTSDYSEKVVLENVIIGGNGTVYTISCDQGLNQGLVATNCTFNGWTSFAGTLGEAKFVNCSFGEGSGYKYCRPYCPTEFVNCTFSEGYAVDTTQATVTFTDCVNPSA